MLNLIYCEIFKLKRSKMLIFAILGTQAIPVMMLFDALQEHIKNKELLITLALFYENSLIYIMLLMNMMIFVAITAYLFSREYTEKTLKNLIPIPLSRNKFLIGKYLTLLLLILILMIFTWAGILCSGIIFHFIYGLAEFRFDIIVNWLFKILVSGILMFVLISPFAYIAEKSKGLVIPMIISAVVVMVSAALSNQELGALYPWTTIYLLMNGKLYNNPYPLPISVLLIVVISLLGYIMSFRYFLKEDIK